MEQPQDIHIPVEEYDDSADSTYSGDDLSDTASINTAIREHRYENGRRYHAYQDGSYWGPNDEQHNDHLDISHQMFNVILKQRLYLAPIEHPKRVLDVGTGTGIWAIDMADAHPEAEVIGVDLSPTQPQLVPPNCRFEVDDAASPWTFPPNYFDLVHIRALLGSLKDWPAFYRECYEHIEPGGWINHFEEAIEFKCDDGSLGPGHPMLQWTEVCMEAGERMGRTFKIAPQAKQLIKEAGFINVVEEYYKIPVGPWSSDPWLKEIGRWNLLHSYHGAEGWGLRLLTQVMGWSLEEAQIMIAKFKNAVKDRRNHSYFEGYVVYGQKPYDAPYSGAQTATGATAYESMPDASMPDAMPHDTMPDGVQPAAVHAPAQSLPEPATTHAEGTKMYAPAPSSVATHTAPEAVAVPVPDPAAPAPAQSYPDGHQYPPGTAI